MQVRPIEDIYLFGFILVLTWNLILSSDKNLSHHLDDIYSNYSFLWTTVIGSVSFKLIKPELSLGSWQILGKRGHILWSCYLKKMWTWTANGYDACYMESVNQRDREGPQKILFQSLYPSVFKIIFIFVI